MDHAGSEQLYPALALAYSAAGAAAFEALHVDLAGRLRKREVVGAEAGAILLHDPEADQLVFRHVEGGGGAQLEARVLPLTMGIASQVFASGQAHVSQDVTAEAAHARSIGEEVGYTTHDMVTVPLSRRAGRPVGVMQVLNKQTGRFDEHDLHLLQALGSQVALAIEQARLYQEARLAEVVRLLERIYHEIKNYLTPVRGWPSRLQDIAAELPGEPADPRVNRAREDLLLCASGLRNTWRRAENIAMEMKDCVEGASAPLKLTPCDVPEIAGRVLDTLRLVAEQEGVTLRLEVCEGLPSVEADEDRLFSLVYNLVYNAIAAVRQAGRPGETTVSLSAGASAGTAIVEVRDTGCGVDAETLESLFTRGARSVTTLGTGLGTKIVRDVVDLHGGTIRAESGRGTGTAVRIELPVSHAPGR